MTTALQRCRRAAALRPAAEAPRIIIAILFTLLVACAGTPSPPSMTEAPPLIFGLTADYPPFAWRDAEGRLIGADVLAARRVADELGIRAEFVSTSWATALADFSAGRFDVLIGGISVTPERAAVGSFSLMLMRDGKRALVRCADAIRLRSVEAIDRPEVRLMVNRGPTMDTWAGRTFPRASLTVNRDDATLIPFLLENRVDVWMTDGVVVDHMARRHAGLLCAPVMEPLLPIEKAWLIRRDPGLVGAINHALRGQLRSGAWRRDLESAP